MSFFESDGKKLLKPIIVGVLTSVVIALILTCLFAWMITLMSGVPYGAIDYAMVGIEGVSVLSGAYFAGVIAKSKGLMIGAVCAGITLLLLFACGLGISQNDIGVLTLIKCAVILLCGVGGGIAGVNRKEKVRIK